MQKLKKNIYISQCCEKPATKDPLKMPKENRVGRLGHSPKNEGMKQGLHGFRCTGCRKPCSCNRHVVDVEAKKTATA